MGHEGSRATDQDFDAVAEAFEGEIYGSSKGMVRFGVLQVDLLSAVPALGSGGLSVLDAGGGAGRLAVLLAEAGNRVVLADPSREMLPGRADDLGPLRLLEDGVLVHTGPR